MAAANDSKHHGGFHVGSNIFLRNVQFNKNLQMHNGDVKISPNKAEWETFTVVGGSNGRIGLYNSTFKKYVSARPNAEGVKGVDALADWELFTVAPHANGFSLKSAHNTFLRSDGTITNLTAKAAEWESWVAEPIYVAGHFHPGHRVYVKNVQFGKYLQMHNGDVKITPNKAEWETFTVVGGANGKIGLYNSTFKKYVSARPNAEGVKGVDALADWELFSVVAGHNNGHALLSAHNTYLRSDGTIANLTAKAAEWESWVTELAK